MNRLYQIYMMKFGPILQYINFALESLCTRSRILENLDLSLFKLFSRTFKSFIIQDL